MKGWSMQCVPLPTGIQVCTMKCTPDDYITPLIDEDNCPKSSSLTPSYYCADFTKQGKDHYCMRKCNPVLKSNDCPAGIACHPSSVSFTNYGSYAICAMPACTSNTHCPVILNTVCKPSASGQCAGLPTGVFCHPDTPGSSSGRCALPGVCEKASGLCDAHKHGTAKAKVGDPCDDDRDCAGQMRCMQQETKGGVVEYRNGYCTIPGCAFAKTLTLRQCTTESVCSMLYAGGMCLKSCSLSKASDCRGQAKDLHGDYDCRAWDKLMIGGAVVAKTPVCEPGHNVPCDIFGNTSTLDCTYLGLKGNTTNMTCRDRKSGKVLTKGSPQGLCLDTTTSGKTYK